MKQFHKEIQKANQDLQYDELLQLFIEYKETKSQPIRDKIFNSNTKLVFSICKKYKYNTDDVEQLGFLGLLNAINGFDPTKKIRFSTYATRVIINEINNGVNLTSKVIPIPKHYTKKVKEGIISEIHTTNLENIQLENEAQESCIDDKIDSQLFWLMLKELCSEEEINIMIKMYCSEHETKLVQVARSINQTKQATFNKIQRIIERLRANEVFKNNVRFTDDLR